MLTLEDISNAVGEFLKLRLVFLKEVGDEGSKVSDQFDNGIQVELQVLSKNLVYLHDGWFDLEYKCWMNN